MSTWTVDEREMQAQIVLSMSDDEALLPSSVSPQLSLSSRTELAARVLSSSQGCAHSTCHHGSEFSDFLLVHLWQALQQRCDQPIFGGPARCNNVCVWGF